MARLVQKRIRERTVRSLNNQQTKSTTMGTILLIVLILLLVGALPTWGHSKNWGYGPTGGIGLILAVIIILILLGKI
jgi:uncharacterized membrane protein YkgB